MRRAGTRRRIGRVASQRRSRNRLAGRFDLMTGPFSGTQRSPSQNMRWALLSATPAGYESPVALRPRLATGVLFRGGRPLDGGQPRDRLRAFARNVQEVYERGG